MIAGNEFDNGEANGDVNGRILCRYDYDAFGNTISEEETIRNRYDFTGEMHDKQNGVASVSESGREIVAKPNQAQGFSSKGYNPQPGERTVKGYVEQNANPEVALYTKSSGFNNSKGNAGGEFKRLGAEEHYGLSPHVYQPVRNVAPNGTIYGKTGKTVGIDTLSPSNKDVKQLYEYLNNGKYHQ